MGFNSGFKGLNYISRILYKLLVLLIASEKN